MLAIDLVIVLLIAVVALAGARLGLQRALPIAGFAAGVLLGSRVPLLVGQELDSDYALNVAAVAALLLGAIGAALGEAVARRASGVVGRRFMVDRCFGALFTGVAAVVVVWALAPAVSEIGSVRENVRRSEALQRFNAVVAPVRPPRDEPPPAPDFPRSAGRPPATAAGEPRLRARPEVKRAVRNVVKIVTNRCGGATRGPAGSPAMASSSRTRMS